MWTSWVNGCGFQRYRYYIGIDSMENKQYFKKQLSFSVKHIAVHHTCTFWTHSSICSYNWKIDLDPCSSLLDWGKRSTLSKRTSAIGLTLRILPKTLAYFQSFQEVSTLDKIRWLLFIPTNWWRLMFDT